MSRVEFVAQELRTGGEIAGARYAYEATADGWRVRREGMVVLKLGPG